MKGLTSCFISPITKVFPVMKGSPSGGPFVVGVGGGKMNQYWSLSGPVLVANSDQYSFAS